MAADSDVVADAVAESKYAADISRKMQVPDRITVSGGAGKESPTRSMMMGGFRGGGGGGSDASSWSGRGSEAESAKMMQVPDRILLAGNNAHVAARSTPRELQLENSVMPTSPEHVRVYTPPRSIRLDDNAAFPAAMPATLGDMSDDDDTLEQSYNNANGGGNGSGGPGAGHRVPSSNNMFNRAGSGQLSSSLGKDNSFMVTSSGGGGGAELPQQNMTTFEELQLVRRQIAKLNHRLMAVELENQQQQQREMIFTVLVTAYFFGKFIFWVNRNT